jgi:hypothetical protein
MSNVIGKIIIIAESRDAAREEIWSSMTTYILFKLIAQ